ncbi:type III secretion system export apparatus subunit SctT [Pseudovibrio sp. Tun.PSC04-5.I4]|uniref:type III secretion system export apparatus subunit SctT n=1 Tax=Pseudovibrio sp. Tun.PSC04-5.I4 TaxID=1798213 RepID=UPI00088EC666|nr:type III secretion system export apparatus subunit SctT [Pseudovibrio sp. Tun.PSC04-5.I4]SDR14612.1 type III secretion protein T [Pseudovibrio sp. Tun.PSC04-5.I4]
MDLVADITSTHRDSFLVLLLTFPRIFAVFATSQLFNTTLMSKTARNVVVMVIAIPLYPVNLQYVDGFSPDGPTFVAYFFKEYAIGFLIGYVISCLLWAVQSAGTLIDNQRGAAVASSIDPMLGNESSPIGDLFSRGFILYLFLTPGFFFILNLVYDSYVIFPVTKFIPVLSPDFPELILSIFDNAMRLMFIMAAPLVILMFLAEFALAIISRFDPQIQVFILAMPIKSGVAVVLLTFYLSFLLPEAATHQIELKQFTDKIFEVFQNGEQIYQDRRGEIGP